MWFDCNLIEVVTKVRLTVYHIEGKCILYIHVYIVSS
jgi:hypothetical protein